jgi:hypothetical protein
MDSSWLIRDAEKFENDLWTLPGLDNRQFYAAAYYLSIAQAQQKKEWDTTQAVDVDMPSGNPSDTKGAIRPAIIDLFLDLLALLFARFKKKSHTPANVTATGLIIEAKRWEIWIAKNGGAYVNTVKNQGISNDGDFLGKLQNWLMGNAFNAAQDYDQTEGPADTFWIDIIEFWSHRITHYVKHVQKGAILVPVPSESNMMMCEALQSALPQGVDEQASNRKTVRQIYHDQVWDFLKSKSDKTDKVEFEKDWKCAIQLTEHLAFMGGTDQNATTGQGTGPFSWIIPLTRHKGGQESFPLHFHAFEKLFEFRNRATRQIYPPAKDPKDDTHQSATAYREFRNRISNLEMLGTPLTIWRVFNLVRDKLRSAGVSVDVSIIDAFPSFTMGKPTLAATIESWRGLEKSEHRSKILDELKRGESRPFTRYFHCELQMLRLLFQAKADGRNPHAYIGVSKLSCHSCWSIMVNRKAQGIEFRTKEGHHRISANCAFPFDITAGYGYIPEAIAQLQASMLQNILREAVKLKGQYTAYSLQDNTVLDSIPGSFDGPVPDSTSRLEEPRFSTSDEVVRVKALRYDAQGHRHIEEVILVYEDTLQQVLRSDLYPRNHTDGSSQNGSIEYETSREQRVEDDSSQDGSSQYESSREERSQDDSDEEKLGKNEARSEEEPRNRETSRTTGNDLGGKVPRQSLEKLRNRIGRTIYPIHPTTGKIIDGRDGMDFASSHATVCFRVHYDLNGTEAGNKWAYRALTGQNAHHTLDNWFIRGDIWVFKIGECSDPCYEHIDRQTTMEQDYFEHLVPPMRNRWEEVESRNRLFWRKRLADIEVYLIAMLRKDYESWQRYKMFAEQQKREDEIRAMERARSSWRGGRLYRQEMESRSYGLNDSDYDTDW